MARRLRYHLPGATYHVILRGNNGQNIFFNDRDRCKMCLLIQEGVERFGHRIFAFCFMSNHVHLAIQIGQINLSRIMQNLSFRYTRYINWRRKRIGHLFQGRFKSILVDSSRYLKELVRYIHLNPVRGGMVDLPEQYQWCSHNVYLGTSELVWITPECLLTVFGDCADVAISGFQSFIHAGIGMAEELDFERGAYEGMLGDDEFVEMVMENAELIPEVYLSVPELVKSVCDYYETDIETLKKSGKARGASDVRAILALLVRESNNLTLEELARIVERDASSLSKHAARLTTKSLKSKKFQHELSEIRASVSQMPECQA